MINPYTILKNLLLALLIFPASTYTGFAQSSVTNRVNTWPLRIDPLVEGKTYTFNIQLDEPIICPSASTPGDCYVIYYIDNPEPNLIDISPCWIRWDIFDWSVTRQFTIRGIPHYLNVPQREFTIKPRVIESKSDYYSGYQPAAITIKTKPVPTATCSSTGDPHYTTFDGYYFHYYGRGKTWLVNGGPNLAIQTVTHGSGYSRNCAVATLENGNYAMVSVCRGYIEFASSFLNPDKTTHPTVIKSGSNYDIKYPSGVAISFQTWGSNANVYVTLPGTYYQAGIAGLCGNWDGNAGNEALSYVYNEITQLPLFAVITANQVDLFSVTQAQIQASVIKSDTTNSKLLQGKCDYTPPKYVMPILNNPDVEDITNIIKQIAQQQQQQGGGFIAGEQQLVFDLPEEDIQEIIPIAPVNNDAINELTSSCRAFAAHPDLVRCPTINPTQDITACLADLKLHPSQEVVATSLTALLARCKTMATLAIVPKDTSQESANNAVQAIVAVDPCFGVTCNLGSRCNPANMQCQCIDPGMRGIRCNIPINSQPAVTSFRPVMLQMERNPSINTVVNPAFIEITNFDAATDTVACMVNGNLVNATVLSENLISCNTVIKYGIDGKVFVNGREIQEVQNGSNDKIYSLVNKWEIIINGKYTNRTAAATTWQQFVYSNPCVHCSVDQVTQLETCKPAENTCFPSGYSKLTTDGISTAVIATATCVAPEYPVAENPCQICRNHSTVFVPLSGCMPKFARREHVLNAFEDDAIRVFNYSVDTRILDQWQSLPYLNASYFVTKILASNTAIVAGSSNITIAVTYQSDQLTVKLGYAGDILEPVKIAGAGYLALYYDGSVIDKVPISVTIWPKLRTTTITTTTTTKTVTTIQVTDTIATTPANQEITGQTLQPTTTMARCIDLECGDFCYKMRSDVTGCVYKCLCPVEQATTPTDAIPTEETFAVTNTMYPDSTTAVEELDIKDSNTVITGKSAGNSKIGVPGIVILSCIALVILITMIIIAIRVRNMPMKDVPGVENKPTENMEYNPLYLGMSSVEPPTLAGVDNIMYHQMDPSITMYQDLPEYHLASELPEEGNVVRARQIPLVTNSIYSATPGMPNRENIYGGCADTGYNNSRIKNTPVHPDNSCV